MKKTIDVTWSDNMKFTTNIDGHNLILDAAIDNGGFNEGPRPKALMMVALAGCTGMDVVSILAKMKVELDNFDVKVGGEQSEEQPVHYISMHIIYEFWGKDLPKEKLEKAISLSQERYCGVAAVYKQVMPVTYELVVHDTK